MMMTLIMMMMEVVVMDYLFVVVTHMTNVQFVRILIQPVSCLVRSALDLCGQSDDILNLAKCPLYSKNIQHDKKRQNL